MVTSADESWQWGGCSDNVDIGVKMSQAIIDHLDDIISDVITTVGLPVLPTSIPLVKKSKVTPKMSSNATSSSNITDFHDDKSTTIASKRRKKQGRNYVINLNGSSKSRRNRRNNVVRSKSESRQKAEMGEDLSKNIKSLLNLHNNEVGRKVVELFFFLFSTIRP